MKSKSKKMRIILIFMMIFGLIFCTISYAKGDPYAGEVSVPVPEDKNNVSEDTIMVENPYHEYNPLNPVKENVDKEEYDSVDNFNIDLKTLNTRIKYFCPTYKNAKASAQSSLWMSFYAKGGSDDIIDNAGSFFSEYTDLANEYKAKKIQYIAMKNNLSTKDPDYAYKSKMYSTLITTYDLMYSGYQSAYNMAIRTVSSTRTSLGLKNTLAKIATADNMTALSKARDQIEKNLTSAVLSYLQLRTYVDILEKQTALYKDTYELQKKNMDLGLATAVDVKDSLDTYENQKATLKSTKATMQNVKEQIANNLGYKITDLDKLNFIEPEPDISYITSIDVDKDKEQAYNSNATYLAISLSDKDKKLPGSTGENLMNQRKTYVAEKVVTSLEDLYQKLRAALISYQGSEDLIKICDINDKANDRKKETNLVSDLEYNGLVLQNLANKLQVKVIKYNLITATDNYYYGTLGQITVS